MKEKTFQTDADKVFEIISRGNDRLCGDELLRQLNESDYYIVKVWYDPNDDKVKIKLVKTGYWKCQ